MNVRQLAARVNGPAPAPLPAPPRDAARPPNDASFAEVLERLRQPESAPAGLTVSAHAAERLAERGISLNESEQARMTEALRLLESKGAREALLLRADAAFVVSVENRTVVTAMSQTDLRDRAFTGIDSAFVL